MTKKITKTETAQTHKGASRKLAPLFFFLRVTIYAEKELFNLSFASFFLSRRVDESFTRIITGIRETKFDGRRESQFRLTPLHYIYSTEL
jgi:hypothetical protein